jgi:thiamine biosynthesis protein ThiC
MPRIINIEEGTRTQYSSGMNAHAVDLAKGHPGAQYRDNAISKARFEWSRRESSDIDWRLRPARRARRLQAQTSQFRWEDRFYLFSKP